MGTTSRKTIELEGSGKLSLNASVVKLTQPPNQCKNTRLKSTWTTGEAGPFINFEASARDAKPIWGASQVQRHWQEPLLQFWAALLIQVLAGQHFKKYSSNLLMQVGVPLLRACPPLTLAGPHSHLSTDPAHQCGRSGG